MSAVVKKITAQFAHTFVSVPCRGWDSSSAFISANKQHYLMVWGGKMSERDHAKLLPDTKWLLVSCVVFFAEHQHRKQLTKAFA